MPRPTMSCSANAQPVSRDKRIRPMKVAKAAMMAAARRACGGW